MSPKQKKIAAKAPPPDKIDAKDFAVLKAEKAKGRGMGLQDEKLKPGKVQKAFLGKMIKGAGKSIGRLFGAKKSATATPGTVTMSKSGIGGEGGMLPQLLQKAIDDGIIKPASKGRMMKAFKGGGADMGLQDEKVKPGKVMKAKRGKFLRSDPTKPISSVQPSTTLPKDFVGKRKALGGVRASLGMLKGPAKAGAILGAALTVPVGKMLKKIQDKRKAKNRDEAKVKKMAGGMMQRPMGYKRGKMFDGYLSTFDASAEASTPKSQRGVTTIVGVKPGAEIGKGKKRFTSMEAMRTAKGFRTIDGKQETSSQFNKRRMALAAAKKAAKASTFGKIALGIGAAGVAAQQYLKSKMKKDEPKKKMVGGMAKKYSVGGGMMQRPMGGPMGGMMQRPMGYKHGTKPGAGPLGAAGLRQPAKENIDQIIKDQKFPPISIYIEDKKKPQKPFPVPSLYNNNKKPSAGRIREDEPRAKKMGEPKGFKSGTMVKARGCKLGRTRPTKMY